MFDFKFSVVLTDESADEWNKRKRYYVNTHWTVWKIQQILCMLHIFFIHNKRKSSVCKFFI